jgi:hypothetical protein
MKSIPRSTLLYFCVALTGAFGLTVLEQVSKVDRAIVSPLQVDPQPHEIEKIKEFEKVNEPDKVVPPSMSQLGPATDRPFVEFGGTWSGAGVITLNDGTIEEIRCRATYSVTPAGSGLNLTLGCASDSYRFNLSTNVTASGNALSGNWNESSRNTSGTLDGDVSGGRIEFLMKADGFSATFAVQTRGNEQNISIRQENTGFRRIEIALSR